MHQSPKMGSYPSPASEPNGSRQKKGSAVNGPAFLLSPSEVVQTLILKMGCRVAQITFVIGIRCNPLILPLSPWLSASAGNSDCRTDSEYFSE